MITAWVTAYEVAQVAAVFGPSPWRLRAIAAALATCRDRAARVGAQLDWLARQPAQTRTGRRRRR